MNIKKLKISLCVSHKLHQKHKVSYEEIKECFINRQKGFLEDTRLNHLTGPPTLWFIAETNTGRRLKFVFIALEDKIYEIKTAYEPNLTEVRIYENYA